MQPLALPTHRRSLVSQFPASHRFPGQADGRQPDRAEPGSFPVPLGTTMRLHAATPVVARTAKGPCLSAMMHIECGQEPERSPVTR